MKKLFLYVFVGLIIILSGVAFAGEEGKKSEAKGIFGPEGGILEVTDSHSPLYGVKLVIPKDSLKSETLVSISIVDKGPELPEGRCWDKAGNRITVPKGKPITKIISISPKNILKLIKLSIPFDGTKVKDKNRLFAYGYVLDDAEKNVIDPWTLLTPDQSDLEHNILNVYLYGSYYNVQLVEGRHPDECYTSPLGRD